LSWSCCSRSSGDFRRQAGPRTPSLRWAGSGAAAINFPLRRGDQLWTTQGASVQINHLGGSAIHLREQTLVEIDDFQKLGDRDQLRLALSRGKVYAVIAGDASYGLMVQVDTPNLSARAESGTTFQVESIEAERATHISIIQGEAVVQTEGSSSRLEAGRAMIARGGGIIETRPMAAGESSFPGTETPTAPPYGDSGKNNGGYVPEPLRSYTEELNPYGYWTRVDGYGTVWVPTAVPAGWAPFSHGRWVFRSPHYVWVSSWPWGWVPFHYGRWSYGVGVGWFWVPPYPHHVYWNPGAVGWWQTDSHIYWVPLAPYELYYGFGYFGHWSVNISFFFGQHHHRHHYFVEHFRQHRHKFHRLRNHKFHNLRGHRRHRAVSGLSISAFLHGGSKHRKFARAVRDGRTLSARSVVPHPVIKARPQTMVPSPAKLVSRKELPRRGSAWSRKWTRERKATAKGTSSGGTWQTRLWSRKPSGGRDAAGSYDRFRRNTGSAADPYDKFRQKRERKSARERLSPPGLKPGARTDRSFNKKNRAYRPPTTPGKTRVQRDNPGSRRKYGGSSEKGGGIGPKKGASTHPVRPQTKAPPRGSGWRKPYGRTPPAPGAPSRSRKGRSWGRSTSGAPAPPGASSRGAGTNAVRSFSAPRKSPGNAPSAPHGVGGGRRGYSSGRRSFSTGKIRNAAPPAKSRGGYSRARRSAPSPSMAPPTRGRAPKIYGSRQRRSGPSKF